MARRKGGPNKSQAVRDILKQKPDIAVKDVVATMAGKGMKITPNLVYFIKGKLKGGKQRRKKIVRAARAASANGDPVALIRDVRALAERSGGFRRLKELVEALAQ